MSLVSVIVPCYNHERFLRKRIDGILAQTFTDFELILLDDHSTDRSAEILRSYSCEARVTHIVVNEENSGNPFAQWERGLALAQGKYVWIAESDDYAEPTLLERCIGVLQSNESLAICQVGAIIVDEDENVLNIGYERWSGEGDGRVRTFDGKTFASGYLVYYNFLYNASGIVFKKSAAEPFPQKCKEMRSAGDWRFWLEMCEKGGVAIVREKLNFFRYSTSSASRRSRYTAVKEDIDIFEYNLSKGYFSKVRFHAYLCMKGHLLRDIKHLQNAEERMRLLLRIKEVTGSASRFAYHYSQFTKMLNYVLPFCIFRLKRQV